MTVRNLDAIFAPKSVALIGASDRPHAVGAVIARNLLGGGFGGQILPVNAKHDRISGLRCYPDVASLPIAPDLAVICTPAASVPGLIAELGARGTKGAVVVSAGFRDTGLDAGRNLEREMLAAAQPHLLRIVGPNCIGTISTSIGLNASFASGKALPGHVAFVAQSGAIVGTVVDWACARGIGFSHLVSLGDMVDVDFGDMLDYLANDPDTHAIVLYIEGVTQARKFLSAARAAARLKPVIAIKAGRAPQAARAAASHTGALAGADAVYDAAFRRAGILRVRELDEIFDAVETLAKSPRIYGDRLAILTNGGGIGVLATDALIESGGRLAALDAETIERLNQVLPTTWSHANPVDIIGDADGNRYAAALKILQAAPDVDAILTLHCPTAIASGLESAQSVVAAIAPQAPPLLTSWLGSGEAEDARDLFASAGIASYDTPEKAVRGFMHLVHNRRAQDQLMEVPSAASGFEPNRERARAILRKAHTGWLNPIAAQELLACYGIAVARSAFAATPDDVFAGALAMGGPLALKIVSPDILHKSDAGGVVVDIPTPDAAKESAAAMIEKISGALPSARLEGFLIQKMVRRTSAVELIVGMATDATFGPYLLFGHGGVAVEQIADRALALPPLNANLAREMMSQTRVWRLLQDYRDHPSADIAAIAETLVRLSQLVCDLDRIVELDINPLLADTNGAIALDARIRIGERAKGLAIKPYPAELEDCGLGPDGRTLRPVRPEDAPAFERFFARLTPQDIRHRFFAPLRALPHKLLARFTQIDYDREMALALFDGEDIVGVSRLSADPDGVEAEFAVLVRSDLKGRGIGRLLLERLIAYARSRGIARITGQVLEDNVPMLSLCRELGFALASVCGVQGVVRADLELGPVRSATDSRGEG
jgi:acetyltransferase